MRSNFFSALAAGVVAVSFLASCASKPKNTGTDEGAAASGTGSDTPAIGSEPIGFDPQGSDSGKISGLSTIYFDYDKAQLSSDARKKLAQNADWIKSNSGYTVQVEGHTDERGSVEYNLALGERRAKSVRAYLESLGIDGKRMTIISYGEEKPIDPSHEESAWSKNRRANFVPVR